MDQDTPTTASQTPTRAAGKSSATTDLKQMTPKQIDAEIERMTKAVKEAKKQRRLIALQAERAKAKADRAADTRRKILVGAYTLELLRKGEVGQKFFAAFDSSLTRSADQSLFDDMRTRFTSETADAAPVTKAS